MKQLNVCLMNDSFAPVIDGVTNCVLNYAETINRKFGSVTVCTPSYPGAEDKYDFPVIRYPSFDMTKLFGYRAGFPLDKRTLRELIQHPIILTYHSKFDVDIRQDIKSKAIQEQAISAILANIEACDEVWTVSHGAAQSLRALGYQGDYIVMENGVDLPRGVVSREALRQIDQEYHLRRDVPVLLFVGRLVWYKGIRTILDGLKLLKAQEVPFQMLFVGSGMDEVAIRHYAASCGLTDCCQFVPAVSDREKLRAFYSRGDLFLFPSTYDTNGLVVREAAACGTASLTLRDSCAAEGITHLRNGLIIDNTPEALAAETAHLLETKDAPWLLGQRAMDELYLSWEDSISRAYRRYETVIDRFYTHRNIRHGKSDTFFKTIAKLYRTDN